MKNRVGVLYSYNGPGKPTWEAVTSGRAPRERLFGAFQLSARGLSLQVSDDQWLGRFARLRRRLPELLEFPSIGLLRAMRNAECVVIQGRIAPLLQLAAWLFGCRFVYIDVMFELPRRSTLAAIIGACLRRAHSIVSYSASQNRSWIRRFDLKADRITAANYPIDSDFYVRDGSSAVPKVQLLAVGRDPGRDFYTLTVAAKTTSTPLKLVTLDYLIPTIAKGVDHIDVVQRLEYSELFAEYSRSIAAVVPLKPGVDYPSGIRAVLEAMLLEVPVIATRTPVLEEHFEDGVHLLFVQPESPESIVEAVRRLRESPELGIRLATNAHNLVRSRFAVEQFADTMQRVLVKLGAW